MNEMLDRAPDRAEVLKMVNRITTAIGKSDPVTVFVACSMIMHVQADLLGISMEKKK